MKRSKVDRVDFEVSIEIQARLAVVDVVALVIRIVIVALVATESPGSEQRLCGKQYTYPIATM